MTDILTDGFKPRSRKCVFIEEKRLKLKERREQKSRSIILILGWGCMTSGGMIVSQREVWSSHPFDPAGLTFVNWLLSISLPDPQTSHVTC